MKTQILIGVIALGSAAVAFAENGARVASAGNNSNPQQRDMTEAQRDYAPGQTYTLPDGTVVCPWDRSARAYWDDRGNYQSSVDPNAATAPARNQWTCRHWYGRFVPGHSTRCDWTHHHNTQANATGCCW